MKIFEVVLGIIAGVGGIGAVFLGVVKFTSGIIADKLQKKYQLQIDKELEKYKAGLENKVYISKTRFDVEFLIFQNLSKAITDCIKRVNILVPTGIVSQINGSINAKLEWEQLTEAANAFAKAQDELNASIPFIPESLGKKYSELLQLVHIQLTRFLNKWQECSLGKQNVKSALEDQDYARADKINEKYISINDQLREYLSHLDIT